jgi:Flagellin hook IN motif
MFELFGIGKAWEGAFRKEPTPGQQGIVADSPISASALKVNSASQGTDDTRSRFLGASDALRSALGGFARETKPVYTTSLSESRSTAALLSGKSARINPFTVNYDVLRTTSAVNTADAGVTRESTTVIGLDVTSAESASRLASNGNLGLDVTGTASTITSKAEMNTGVTTSYGSNDLTFSQGGQTSSSEGTLTGTYAGTGIAANATSLTFKILKGGTLANGVLGLGGSEANVELQVTDQNGTEVFKSTARLGPGDSMYLGAEIGLSISFSAGDLKANHSSTVTVTKTPISVDANATFNNANTSLRPKFDNNAQVTAGSFTINGTSIAVNANDSINSVLSRINSSGAGVTASLSGDKITLVTNANSENDIKLENDTSNFLKATQLDGASTVKGDLRDDERVLSQTSWFSSVTSGSFQINGVAISLDKDNDTLNTLITRINGSGAGVTASFNSSTSRVELVTNSNSEDLITLSNDATGFVAAANLTSNRTVRGNVRDDQQILAKTSQFAAVTTGSFTVNGVSISVNKDTDTLASVISRVNSSGADVTASYDAATDKLVFTPNGGSVTLADDTSGFLAAAHVATGTTSPYTEANPDAAFNATGAAAPMFDAGYSVQAGTFSVNGVAINVAVDDSINSVLAKITASAAGVTATYDSTTELVTLTAKEGGTGPITLGADTSGFLAAVKLDGTAAASVSSVAYSSFTSAIGDISEYSGVIAGTLTVNGQDIAIDPATTTVRGLVDALNNLTGVDASVNETTGGINIWSESTGTSLTISDTSGVLSALGVSGGTYTGTTGRSNSVTTRTGSSTTSNAFEVASNVSAALDGLNEALAALDGEDLADALETIVSGLRDNGIRGFQVTREDDDAALSLSRDELVNALNALNEDTDLATAIAGTFERFSEDVATVAGWNAEAPAAVQMLSLEETSRAQLLADQTATSLLLLRSSLQPQESQDSTQKAAMKAYGEAV